MNNELGGQPSALLFRDLGDRRGLWIYRMNYTHKIVLGPIGVPWYDNHWCYKDLASATAAFNAWNPATEAEPTGWVRHPDSGRRRFPDGDPATEEVRL